MEKNIYFVIKIKTLSYNSDLSLKMLLKLYVTDCMCILLKSFCTFLKIFIN
ncbi:hypothetical protein [Arsenophonus endosymbiont of Bemisia tabaci]|uniref:hypothetical protein n=1 Tax=Arsenophonus endosymbiont of Bemisia tabaci TaxID=536059 RepID=UPI0015F6E491|nr:hypothetical protein [Arsenophonus endosymbiont of Bemisia tabaci]